MNVASLELCKELYELSEWDGCRDGCSKYPAPEPIGHDYRLEVRSNPDSPKRGSIPAYDLGYLLRKLPQAATVSRVSKTYGAWIAGVTDIEHALENPTFQEADTPENAAAKLAIELFRQGVLQS